MVMDLLFHCAWNDGEGCVNVRSEGETIVENMPRAPVWFSFLLSYDVSCLRLAKISGLKVHLHMPENEDMCFNARCWHLYLSDNALESIESIMLPTYAILSSTPMLRVCLCFAI
jgi:hypothetical protein